MSPKSILGTSIYACSKPSSDAIFSSRDDLPMPGSPCNKNRVVGFVRIRFAACLRVIDLPKLISAMMVFLIR